MRDPDATREKILKHSGILFNTNGYKATSISEITEATGFTKGAIYRHFESKDDLERSTLAFLSQLIIEKMKSLVKDEVTAGDKLRAIFRFFESYVTNPPLKGGCPLLNAAVEADDAHPGLRKEALKMLTLLRESVIAILKNGIHHKQIKSNIDPNDYATLIIAALEGGIMMSKLHGTNDDVKRITKHLTAQIELIEL